MTIYRNKGFIKNFMIKGTIIATFAIIISVLLMMISMPYFSIEISIILFCIPMVLPLVFNFKALTIPQYIKISGDEIYLHSNYKRARIKRNEIKQYLYNNNKMKIIYERKGKTHTYFRGNIDKKIDNAIRGEFL